MKFTEFREKNINLSWFSWSKWKWWGKLSPIWTK